MNNSHSLTTFSNSFRKTLNNLDKTVWTAIIAMAIYLIASPNFTAEAANYTAGGFELRQSSAINFDRHYKCRERVELTGLTHCELRRPNSRNTNRAESVLKTSDGSILYAHEKRLISGDVDSIARQVTSSISRELGETNRSFKSENGEHFAFWGSVGTEPISGNAYEYYDIENLIEQKHGQLVVAANDLKGAKDRSLPINRITGGDGLIVTFSEEENGQILVQRVAVAAEDLNASNFESKALQFLDRDRNTAPNDYSNWYEMAFMIRRLSSSTTPAVANKYVDQVLGRDGNRKYGSHVWAFIPRSVINHLGQKAYRAVDAFGENTQFPEIRRQLLDQLKAEPNEPFSEYLLYALGRFEEAAEFNPSSPIRSVLLYAHAHSSLRTVMAGAFEKVSRQPDLRVLTKAIYPYSFRRNEYIETPYVEETTDARNNRLSKKDFYFGSAYERIPQSKNDYLDDNPTLIQYLNYFNKFPERIDSGPLVSKVGNFATLTDDLLPLFEEVSQDQKSPHFDDATYYLAWLTYHRGDVSASVDRFGRLIALENEGSQTDQNQYLDYSGMALVQLNRIFRTLQPKDVFDRIQNSSVLAPHPIVWQTALTSLYQDHRHEEVMAGAKRALRQFNVRIQDLPVTTSGRLLHKNLDLLAPGVGYELAEISYVYFASREILQLLAKLQNFASQDIADIERDVRDTVAKYSVIGDEEQNQSSSSAISKPKHRDLRQSLFLTGKTLEILPQAATSEKFRQWLHYRRIRLLAVFYPLKVGAANVEFESEIPQSELIDDALAEQVFAEAITIGDMTRATRTFEFLKRNYPDANALDNAHSWMAIGWTCRGNPAEASKINKQIVRLFPMTRHAKYAAERILTPPSCWGWESMWDYRAMQWRERNRIDAVQAVLGNRKDTSLPSGSRDLRETAATRESPTLSNVQARRLVTSLLEINMMPQSEALQRVRSAYADSIDYFGKMTSLDDVIDDKNRYFKRWPIRVYKLQPDTVTADCSRGNVCTISGYFDWAVKSDARGKSASGMASFEYAISKQPPHKIVKETSEVVNR